MGLDVGAIVRRLQEVEVRHPDASADLAPIIEALGAPTESTVGIEQAREILGAQSVDIVERWIDRGVLAGRRDDHSGRWQIPLADVLRLRGTQQALIGAGGEDLTEAELEMLASSRPGTYPWQRDNRP